jgi:ArsR family transcriptional regulator
MLPEDSAFRALSDHTRREILRLLSARPHTVGALVERFHLSQPAMSRHLAVLRQAGLVLAERQGQNVVYSLDRPALRDLVEALLELAARKSSPK